MAASKNIATAKNILRGQAATLQELHELANQLKQEKAFGYARKIFARARKEPSLRTQPDLRLTLAQQHALCTYQDPDLPTGTRFDRALEILWEEDNLQTTHNQETLGLAGAIYKRKWEVDSQKQNLERSLAYYLRGYQEGAAKDIGYTGVNAAFVLDLLAYQEEDEARQAGTVSESAIARRAQGKQIREDIVSTLSNLENQPDNADLQNQWWFMVTVAEAYFGLGGYQEALPYLQKAAGLPNVAEWERETTARQLARLAQLQPQGEAETTEISEAWQVLREFLGHDLAAVRTAFTGKIGLGLSGGGFRASLFHLGVLAKLAELDILRHVEVLSCVSGGSIVGAHYYLEVRKRLQEKSDAQITRQDYICIVQRLERDFLAGVQRNIRTRVGAEWLTNLKMIFLPNYSRTIRVGELYEEEIYSRVKDGGEQQPRWLDELFVKPLGADGKPIEDFTPKYHNWRRAAKVPMLILNATALNTGHNWQFTASWMGEPPANIDTEIDGNYRLRRMYYQDAPPPHNKIRLGHAVAASSCVPGLFEPLTLADLYPDKTVRLVDGGVHDNQGTAALLEQDCTVIIVSDASGQMSAQDHPSNGLLGVPLRSSSILQARVREAQYRELVARRRASLLRGFVFVHLKKDLDVRPLDWLNCQDPYDASDEAVPTERRGSLTRYGIRKQVQERLAAIRTDLDSFSDAEAHALMTSGYRMMEYELPKGLDDFSFPTEPPPSWRFLAVEQPMKQLADSEPLMRRLVIAGALAFKVWQLSRPLQVTATALGLAALGLLGWFQSFWWSREIFSLTLGAVATLVLIAIIGRIVGPTLMRLVQYRKTLTTMGIGIGMSVFGFVAARLHLHLFDRLYLRLGKLSQVIKTPPADSANPPDS